LELVLYYRTKDRYAYDFRAGSTNRPGWLYLPLLYGWKNGAKPDVQCFRSLLSSLLFPKFSPFSLLFPVPDALFSWVRICFAPQQVEGFFALKMLYFLGSLCSTQRCQKRTFSTIFALDYNTRNRVVGDEPARGFESHALRHVVASCISLATTFLCPQAFTTSFPFSAALGASRLCIVAPEASSALGLRWA